MLLLTALLACSTGTPTEPAPPGEPDLRGPLPPLTIVYTARGEGEIAPCG